MRPVFLNVFALPDFSVIVLLYAMLYPVPFFGNTSDNTHCFQASLKMALAYFEPDLVCSWLELDAWTGKLPEMWTWPMQGVLWLHSRGYEVLVIETFDYALFAEKGQEYLVEEFGVEVALAQKEHSDIPREQSCARPFIERISPEKRVPSLEDVCQYLDQGFLQILNVNAEALDERSGYSGHSVLVIGYDERGLILHDPGLPPQPSRHVSYDVFTKAWAYPTNTAQNIVALRLLKSHLVKGDYGK